MSLTPEDPARAVAADDIYRECVQELHQPYPDYAKIQALATLSLAATAREMAGQVTSLSHQITPASRR
jgi:hypothetical protein